MAKQKFPLLEQMRAQRQHQEDEVTEPYKREIEAAAQMIASLRRRLRAIEEALGHETARLVGERFADELAHKLFVMAQDAAMKANPWEPVTLMLSPDIRFADPRSIESEIMRRYKSEILPRLSLSVDDVVGPDSTVTVLDVRLPALGYRHAMLQH